MNQQQPQYQQPPAQPQYQQPVAQQPYQQPAYQDIEVGQAYLEEMPQNANSNKPVKRLSVELKDGRRFEVAFWQKFRKDQNGQPDMSKPFFSGNITEKVQGVALAQPQYQQPAQQPTAQQAAPVPQPQYQQPVQQPAPQGTTF